MHALLGVCDEKITDRTKTSFRDNKIGGDPDWPQDPIEVPQCDLCGRQLQLVVQVYCPLDGLPYHRVLYVFGCIFKPCWNQSQSWKVIRCQIPDETYQHSSESTSKHDTPSDTLAPSSVDTWAADADDWGDGDEVEGSELVSMVTSQPEGSMQEVDRECSTQSEENTTDLPSTEAMFAGKLGCLDLGENGMQSVSLCTPEDLKIQKPEDSILMSYVTHGSNDVSMPSTSTEQLPLCSYYISVFDEPESATCTLKHEEELLRQYVRREGVDIGKMANISSSSEATEEKYEKATVKHGDLVFHKFHKRVSRCPEQILRYCYNGEPLHIQNTDDTKPTKCGHCGSPRVFELQLMPALVNLLRHSPETDPVIEFGTVLIYTCKKSCWTSGATCRYELALVEMDPDQNLFLRQQV